MIILIIMYIYDNLNSIATISIPNCKDFHKISNLFKDYNIRVIPALYRCLQSIIQKGKDKSKTLDQTQCSISF